MKLKWMEMYKLREYIPTFKRIKAIFTGIDNFFENL